MAEAIADIDALSLERDRREQEIIKGLLGSLRYSNRYTSKERREREVATTQISQMYNLLTGYDSGTNRALFLMPRRPFFPNLLVCAHLSMYVEKSKDVKTS